MSYLFDYGELLICFAPVFVIIAAIGLLLLKNSRPSRSEDSLQRKDGGKTNGKSE